tara:strand:+ start:88 stop:597 length:510 start_codon:yes stop_codon:yes gene_type:complete
MDKKIIIKGKKTFDKIQGVKPKRSSSKIWIENDSLLNKKEQISNLNKLLLGIKYKDDKYVKKELERKLSSYQKQDIKKNKLTGDFITYKELIEKLVISKLKCYYCRKDCLLMFDNVREKTQWTLDRLDNDLGHTSLNTVICCLDCNLKRGTLDDKKFKFTKQLKIIKKY